MPVSVVDGRLPSVTTTSICGQRPGSVDFILNSESRHILDPAASNEPKMAKVDNSARTGRTQSAMTTDARHDKPGGLQLKHQSLEFLAWLGIAP
jgi:hypothetical protein